MREPIWQRTTENLHRYACAVKQRFSPHEPMGIGLWWPRRPYGNCWRRAQLPELAGRLAEWGLVPFTLNGFPQGDFHEPVVKHRVYYPTWWESARVGIHTGPDRRPRCAVARRLGGQYFHAAHRVGISGPESRTDESRGADLDQVIQRLARWKLTRAG